MRRLVTQKFPGATVQLPHGPLHIFLTKIVRTRPVSSNSAVNIVSALPWLRTVIVVPMSRSSSARLWQSEQLVTEVHGLCHDALFDGRRLRA